MLKLRARNQLEYFQYGLGFNCSYEFPIMHTHDYWEFDFVQFDFEHQINGKIVHVYPNSILIVKPSDEHLIRALPSKINSDKAPTHLNIKITKEKLHELVDPIDAELYGLLEKTAPLIQQLNDDSSVNILKSFLFTLLWSNNIEKNLVILKTSLYLIVTLFHQAIYEKSAFAAYTSHEVNEIIEKMNSQKYLGSPISEIASESNYSYMQLTRLFRKETGMTMQNYFLYIKLEYAAEQLRLTKRLTIDISNDIGIFSLSHFNHIFKKRFGIPPGEYRKKYRS